jgi:hypothetical protein
MLLLHGLVVTLALVAVGCAGGVPASPSPAQAPATSQDDWLTSYRNLASEIDSHRAQYASAVQTSRLSEAQRERDILVDLCGRAKSIDRAGQNQYRAHVAATCVPFQR